MSDDSSERTIHVETYYDSLGPMQRTFDRLARAAAFDGGTAAEWCRWRDGMRQRLWSLLGMDLLETCDLAPRTLERVELDGGIVREKVLMQVEPDVWMPTYVLIPPAPADGSKLSCYLAPHGHQGGGKLSIAGVQGIPAIDDAIAKFNYDYGLKLARLGYVALCPDARGWGERRDVVQQKDDERSFLRGTCFNLAHMAEPLGLTVVGLLTWDLMRLVDYACQRDEWRTDDLGCLGFSGGGMQTLWFSALDPRITKVFISGYMYGVRDSLLTLNNNCSCNYVPGLWRLIDMGDLGSMIAPRPVIIQSCTEDHLNGQRGVANADEQVSVMRDAYELLGVGDNLVHQHCPGEHHFCSDELPAQLDWLERRRRA